MACYIKPILIQFDLSIIFIVLPKIAAFDFGSEPSNSGESTSVQCLVTIGDLPLTFKWLHNGRPVSEMFGISTVKLGKRTYALTIDSVSGRHAGNYTCDVSNNAGTDRYNATLIVNGIDQTTSEHNILSSRIVYLLLIGNYSQIFVFLKLFSQPQISVIGLVM